jgi:hypothetical protein
MRPEHRVIGPGFDRAIVEQEKVRDPSEPRDRIAVAIGDRLVGDVAAREDQRQADIREQKVMKGRVGKHHPEVG